MFIDDLEQFYKQNTDSFENINTIVALSRGGLVLAQYLGYLYGIRNIVSIPVIGYSGEDDLGRRDILCAEEYKELLKKSDALVVDDIYDSGASMEAVIKTFKPFMNSFRTMTIFAPNNSVDYRILKHDGRWINFPWDIDIERIKNAEGAT